MRIGLDSYSYHLAFGTHTHFHTSRPLDLFGFMEKLAEYGLQGFQIDPLHLKSTDREYLVALREAIEEQGLFVEVGIMRASARAIEEGVAVCSQLGANVLRTFLGFDRFHAGTSVSGELAVAREQLASCVQMLEQSRIRLAIENHGDVTSTELVDLVEAISSSNVGICLDVGNSLCVLEDPVEAVKRMIPFAFSTHFKDMTVVGTDSGCKIVGVALGTGVLPLDEMYSIIQEEGDLDRLILEVPVEARHGEKQSLEWEDHCVRQSIEFCRNKLMVGTL
jgi:sugar phosphate isomerase/epimerase